MPFLDRKWIPPNAASVALVFEVVTKYIIKITFLTLRILKYIEAIYWKHVKTVPDGQKFRLEGSNVWDYEWIPTGERIFITNGFNHKYKLDVNMIKTEDKSIRFATAEFSNCVWGFYQESDSSEK